MEINLQKFSSFFKFYDLSLFKHIYVYVRYLSNENLGLKQINFHANIFNFQCKIKKFSFFIKLL